MRTGLDDTLTVTTVRRLNQSKDDDEDDMLMRASIAGKPDSGTHRTSIVRASDDAKRARSFSKAGGSTGNAVLPFAATAADNDCRSSSGSFCRCCSNSAEWIVGWGALSGRRRDVKRFGGRAKTSMYDV
jgi:hypothetical protein